MIEVGKFYVLKESVKVIAYDNRLKLVYHTYGTPLVVHIKKMYRVGHRTKIEFTLPFQYYVKKVIGGVERLWIYIGDKSLQIDNYDIHYGPPLINFNNDFAYDQEKLENLFLFEMDDVYYMKYKEFFNETGMYSQVYYPEYGELLREMTKEHSSYLYDMKLYDQEVKSYGIEI